MASKDDKGARSTMSQHVDRAIARGEIRPHEREMTIDRACINWVGQTGNGQAAETAIRSVKEGS